MSNLSSPVCGSYLSLLTLLHRYVWNTANTANVYEINKSVYEQAFHLGLGWAFKPVLHSETKGFLFLSTCRLQKALKVIHFIVSYLLAETKWWHLCWIFLLRISHHKLFDVLIWREGEWKAADVHAGCTQAARFLSRLNVAVDNNVDSGSHDTPMKPSSAAFLNLTFY